jgi:CheY-like chemotaxis protein
LPAGISTPNAAGATIERELQANSVDSHGLDRRSSACSLGQDIYYLSLGTPMEIARHGGHRAAAPKVLCIDEDPQVSEVINLRLRLYGVDVLRAFHGMHGFWLAMTERPDVIVCDMRMPQGAGEYVVDCLRRNSDTQSIPIIILTGQRDPLLERKMRSLGVAEFFTKPILFDALLEAIGRYITLADREVSEWGEAVIRG